MANIIIMIIMIIIHHIVLNISTSCYLLPAIIPGAKDLQKKRMGEGLGHG